MSLRTIRKRVQYWIHWRQRARELAEEIETHRSLRQAALEQDGVPAADAPVASRRALGNVTLAVEDARDVWIVRAFHECSRDLRHGARLLRRNPGFTLAAVLSLAFGIGANTAVFSLMDAVMLKSLPVENPEQLVVLTRVDTRGQVYNMTYPLFERLRQADDVFAGVFAALDGTYNIDATGSGIPMDGKVDVQAVSGNYFEVLGVHTSVGRLLTSDDDRLSQSEPVAVISDRFWRVRFGGDLSAIGRRLTLKRQSLTIVGVAPAGFFGESVGRAPDIWVPVTIQPKLDPPSVLTDPRVGWLRVMARLRDGISDEQARAALTTRLHDFKADKSPFGNSMGHVATIAVEPGRRGLPDTRMRFSQQLWILTTAVGLVLLIACANVANLLLVRGVARRHETVIRLAIGAGRGRLVRQFLIESGLLAFVGGALGVLLAWWGSRALLLLASGGSNPLAIDVSPNLRIVGFTFSLSLVTVLLFGLAPASAATRYDTTGSLKPIAGAPRLRLPRVLLVAQVGLSLLLLTGAGLLFQTLRNLRTLDLGFAAGEIVQVGMNARGAGYSPDQLRDLYRRLLERVSAVPGIRSATMSSSGFRTGSSRTCCIAIQGHIPAPGEEREVQTMNVTSEYFRTMGIPLVKGRGFTQGDLDRATPESPGVAIVNEAMARQFYGTTDIVGTRFGWGDPGKAKFDIEIVGVARNAVYGDLRTGARPLIYHPSNGDRFLSVRAALPVSSIVGVIRREIAAVDPNIGVVSRTIPEILEQSLVMERLLARLSGFFGAMALLLASIGLYGLMAYSVTRRTKEIGLRVALGAQRAGVVRQILAETLGLTGAGILIGIGAALATTRLLQSALFGVRPTDPATLIVATLALVVVATLSAAIPARRAARVEPSVALRHD